MTRPNILLISADQHRADCFGFEGRKIKTPHLNELARQSTRFSSCITSCVVCQPARASILTGQLCRTHGVHDNGIDLDPEIGAERALPDRSPPAAMTPRFSAKPIFQPITPLPPPRLA